MTPNALGELSGKLEKAQEGLRSAVELGLDKLRTDNAEKLEQMRSTVDEKLQVTLETASGRELQAGAPLRIFHNGRYAAGGQSRLGGAFYSGGPASLIITLSQLCNPTPLAPAAAHTPRSVLISRRSRAGPTARQPTVTVLRSGTQIFCLCPYAAGL